MFRLRLDKWYFDCVSPTGDVFIGYAAKLRFGPIGLRYGARITKPDSAPTHQRQWLSFGTIHEAGDRVEWRNASLGVRGTWTGGRRIEPTVLLDGPDGRIEWRCLKTNATVDLSIDGAALRGTGYAEKLSVTVPLWRLPFSELRWGRFIADDLRDHIVWIDLHGTTRRAWVWADATLEADACVGDDRIRVGDRELLLEPSQPIRCENVAATLLGPLRFLAGALPRGLRGIEEDKRVGRNVLMEGDVPVSRGASIYEVVKWL